MSTALRVECSASGERPVRLAVHGDLDYARHDGLDAVLGRVVPALDAGDEIVVDLTGVAYCDSCGLRVLLGAAQRVEQRGARFVLIGVAGQPARALRLTGLDAVLGADTAEGPVPGVDGPPAAV